MSTILMIGAVAAAIAAVLYVAILAVGFLLVLRMLREDPEWPTPPPLKKPERRG